MTEESKTMFDYNEWRKQGQTALESLLSRKESLVAELKDVEVQIKEVKKTIGTTEGVQQRFRLKPIISSILQGKSEIKEVDVVALVKKEKPGASDDQILGALHRYVGGFENVVIVDGVVKISEV